MRHLLITIYILFFGFTVNNPANGQSQRSVPKLVLGIVADPMGHDWIDKYWEYLGPDGLKKLVEGGTSFEQTNLNHFLAGTGPSHASISTGTTPYQHGIIADSWYNRLEKGEISCTKDFLTHTIGSNSQAGKHSLKQLFQSYKMLFLLEVIFLTILRHISKETYLTKHYLTFVPTFSIYPVNYLKLQIQPTIRIILTSLYLSFSYL